MLALNLREESRDVGLGCIIECGQPGPDEGSTLITHRTCMFYGISLQDQPCNQSKKNKDNCHRWQKEARLTTATALGE